MRALQVTRLLILGAVLSVPAAFAGEPLEDGTNANVWVLDADGAFRASFRLGSTEARTENTRSTGGSVDALVKTGASSLWTAMTSVDAATDTVLINDGQHPWPAEAGLPAVSLVGLDEVASDAAQPEMPTLVVQSSAGAFAGASANVQILAYPPAGIATLSNVSVTITRNGLFFGKLSASGVPTYEGSAILVLSGTYVVTATATAIDTVGPKTATVERQYTLSGNGLRRDSDRDGFPDLWEVAHGLSPFDGDQHSDSDGDGWTDVDEALRGSDPTSSTSRPEDTDLDGFSDWDEAIRGTDPAEPGDAPSAHRLMEVEYVIEGSAFKDVELVNALTGPSKVVAVDSGLERLASGSQPAGNFSLRVAGGSDVFVTVTPNVNPLLKVKAGLDGSPDVTPSAVAADIEAESWGDASEWQDDYESALSYLLVREHTIEASPLTLAVVAVVEAQVAFALESVNNGVPVGNVLLEPGGSPVTHFDSDLAAIEALVQVGGPLADLVDASEALFTSPDEATSDALAQRIQRPDVGTAGVRWRYVARLLHFVGGEAAESADASLLGVFEPAADSDLDGILNAVELAPPPPDATNPIHPDTDGDSYADAQDPCSTDATNACLAALAEGLDTDGDGVLDGLDNCPKDKNAEQRDANDDGFGNACETPARIRTPATSLAILPGTSVEFRSVKSALAAPPVTYTWKKNGVTVGTTAHLGALLFSNSGTVVVSLAVTDGLTTTPKVDSRTITVLDVSPTQLPCAFLTCTDGDPCTDDGCLDGSGCLFTPIPECVLCSTAVDCDDGDPCTSDPCGGDGACNPHGKAPNGTECDDDDACTTTDTCSGGLCGGTGATVCNDSDPCTQDSCDSAEGCKATLLAGCKPCTTSTECDDGNPCTTDPCRADKTCGAHGLASTDTLCNDGNPCTGGDHCASGTCTAAGPKDCGDGDPCTIDACTAASGVCTHVDDPNADPAVCPECVTAAECSGGAGCTGGVCCTPEKAADGTPTTLEPATAEPLTLCLAAGQKVSVRAKAGTGPKLTLTLADTAGKTLKTVTATTLVYLEATISVSGAYVLTPKFLTAGTYTLEVFDVPADAVTTVLPNALKVTVVTTVPGQAGVFTFDGAPGERRSLQLDGNSAWCSIAAWTSPAGIDLDTGNTCATSHFFDAQVLTEDGTYAAVFDPNSDAAGPISATLWTVPPDAIVPAPLRGIQYAMDLTVPGQNGAFTFTATAGERLYMRFTPTECGYITLEGPGATPVFARKAICGKWLSDLFVAPATGTYTQYFDTTGSFLAKPTMTVWTVAADLAGNATEGGAVAKLTMTTPGQKGSFAIAALGGTRMALLANAGGCATYFLFDPNNVQLYTLYRCGTFWFDPFDVPADGSYRLEIDPAADMADPMDVTAYNVPPDPTATVVVGGAAVKLTTTVPGQDIAFEFAGTAGQTVTVKWVSASACPTFTLFEPGGGTLFLPKAHCSTYTNTPVVLPADGTYLVTANLPNFGLGSVTMSVY